MTTVDTLINARWVIPVVPQNTVYEHYAVAINAGKIADILPANIAKKQYSPIETLSLDDHALLPGLINSHTHAAMTLFRGLSDDLPLMEWLNNHIWPAEKRWMSAQFVADGTHHAIAEMIRSGTTCFNDMYFFPEQVAEAAIATGIRTVIGAIVIDFPTAWAKDADEYFSKGVQLRDKYKHNPLIHTAFAPHAPYTVSDESLQRISVLANELDIHIHIHLHETQDEIEQSEKQYGKRPLQRLYELNLLSPQLMAVHATQLNDSEIALLAKHGVSVIHCPESNLKLASGFCPVAKLQKHGINIALGTDGAASNNDLDMLGEMRTAALLAKAVDGNSSTLPAHQLIEMATINGAKALGIENLVGSLSVGKSADIISINMNTIESQPLYNPVSHIVYAANRNQISNVWVAGKPLMKDRKLTTIEIDKILNTTQAWQKKIQSEGD